MKRLIIYIIGGVLINKIFNYAWKINYIRNIKKEAERYNKK